MEKACLGAKSIVLILILMEHAQRERTEKRNSHASWVLILILMEHAQREADKV